MLRPNTLLLSALALLLGCTVEPNREDWPDQYADAFCSWERRCMSAIYFDDWKDHDQCLDKTADGVEDLLDAFPGCDFDRRRAEDCLNRLNSNCRDSGGVGDILDICLRTLDC